MGQAGWVARCPGRMGFVSGWIVVDRGAYPSGWIVVDSYPPLTIQHYPARELGSPGPLPPAGAPGPRLHSLTRRAETARASLTHVRPTDRTIPPDGTLTSDGTASSPAKTPPPLLCRSTQSSGRAARTQRRGAGGAAPPQRPRPPRLVGRRLPHLSGWIVARPLSTPRIRSRPVVSAG